MSSCGSEQELDQFVEVDRVDDSHMEEQPPSPTKLSLTSSKAVPPTNLSSTSPTSSKAVLNASQSPTSSKAVPDCSLFPVSSPSLQPVVTLSSGHMQEGSDAGEDRSVLSLPVFPSVGAVSSKPCSTRPASVAAASKKSSSPLPSSVTSVGMQDGSLLTKNGTPILNVSPPGFLDMKSSHLAEDWKLWLHLFKNYVMLSGIENRPDPFKVAVFESCIGIDALRTLNNIQFSGRENRHGLEDVIRKFEEAVGGEQEEFIHRFRFNKRTQGTAESVDQYMAVLRNIAKSCGFCDCMHDKLLMDRLITGIRSDRHREKLLSQRKLDLQTAINICKTKDIGGGVGPLSKATKDIPRNSSSRYGQNKTVTEISKGQGMRGKLRPPKQTNSSDASNCVNCCKTHETVRESCPAWGKVCFVCHLKNHFAMSPTCPGKPATKASDE